ncbi:MAG: hypothetical protein DI618_11290 [Dermacoccus nishinomiyaensis]|nr:MAG: hypothetical protein DI618_11290 [Dermacoccus nishinomiyaensis]
MHLSIADTAVAVGMAKCTMPRWAAVSTSRPCRRASTGSSPLVSTLVAVAVATARRRSDPGSRRSSQRRP